MGTANQLNAPSMTGPGILASTASIQAQDIDSVSVQIGAGLVGTLVFEQSNDAVTWDVCLLLPVANTAVQPISTVANPAFALYTGPCAGKYFRVRCSAYTSGSTSIVIAGYDNLPNPIAVAPGGGLPASATAKIATSGNVANAAANATLAAPGVGLKNYLSGFEVTGAGATAGAAVTVTITGLLGGTISYTYVAATGATVANQPLIVEFSPPLPASGNNVAIAVQCPALGAGNTNNTTVAHGYFV